MVSGVATATPACSFPANFSVKLFTSPIFGWCVNDSLQSASPHSSYQILDDRSTNCFSEAKGKCVIIADAHFSEPQQANNSFFAAASGKILKANKFILSLF